MSGIKGIEMPKSGITGKIMHYELSEYINRRTAEKTISDVISRGGTEAEILTEIYFLPSADVVEVRHEQWINERQEGLGSFSAECSLCGKRTLAYFHYFYCPNCGAKMDGGDANV